MKSPSTRVETGRNEARASTRVLLIDEQMMFAGALEAWLQAYAPHIVVVGKAANTDEGRRLLERAPADVVVLEIAADRDNPIAAIAGLITQAKANVLALTSSKDAALHDAAVLAGARGVVLKTDSPDTLVKAIEKVSQGEIWLDRASTTRVFLELSRKHPAAPKGADTRRIESLTDRERQIAAELAEDASGTAKDIARRLGISERTLRNHLSAIYGKLGVATRLELFAYAREHGIEPARRPSGR